MTVLLLPLFAACLAAAAAGTPLIIVDSANNAYVRQGPNMAFDQSSASALVAAATGLMPGSPIGADLSRELSAVFKPSPLAKPKAFIVLNVAGLSTDTLGELFSGREHRTVELTGDGCPAMTVVNGLSRISAANPTVKLSLLDQVGVQGCKDSCLEQNLADAISACSLDLSGLDLSQKDAKMFVVELGSIYAGLKAELAAAQSSAQDDVVMYEVSLMGLHALSSKNGPDSEAVNVAKNAAIRLLKWVIESLDAAYDGDTVYEVLLLEKGPAQAESMLQLANWKDRTRRQLLQAPYPDIDETAQAKLFSTKAAGYGVFVLLLYFSMAAIWCMCNMPFKQDTLLYGSKKDQ